MRELFTGGFWLQSVLLLLTSRVASGGHAISLTAREGRGRRNNPHGPFWFQHSDAL